MRSSSGPLSRRRWRRRSASPQLQRSSTPAKPHGHGLVAATSMNEVGKLSDCCPRTIVTLPSSRGWRSASRLERWNSESSSRNSTPLLARVASPGRGGEPPPASPAGEIVWCGARNGRALIRPPAWTPATLWMRVTSIASARVSGGRIVGRRRASIVLPVPGRALEQQVVPSGRGDLEGEQRRLVTANVGQVRARCALAPWAGGAPGRDGVAPPASTSAAARRLATATMRRSSTSAASCARVRGTISRVQPHRLRALGHRQRAGRVAQLTAEGELAEDRAAGQRVGGHLAAGREHRQRERGIEARAGLAHERRREVGGDPALGELEAGVEDRRADAVARLSHRGVAEADDGERGQAAADVDLHPDLEGLDPVDGKRRDPGEHARKR